MLSISIVRRLPILRRNSIILVCLVLLLGVVLFVGWRWQDQRDFINNSEVYEDATNGFTFRYPVTWDFIAQDNDLAIRNEKFTVGVSVVGEPSTAVGVIVRARSTQEVIDQRQIFNSNWPPSLLIINYSSQKPNVLIPIRCWILNIPKNMRINLTFTNGNGYLWQTRTSTLFLDQVCLSIIPNGKKTWSTFWIHSPC